MNKLSKRNKILFGILGGVVVILVVGLVLGLTGVINLPLQGGIVSANLTPDSAFLCPGATMTLTLSNFSRNTSWKIGYPAGLQEVSHDRTHITVKNIKSGGAAYVFVYGPLGLELDSSWVGLQCAP